MSNRGKFMSPGTRVGSALAFAALVAACGQKTVISQRAASEQHTECCAPYDATVALLSRDKSFADGGARTAIANKDIKPNAMAVSPVDDAIIVAGSTANTSGRAFTFPPVETSQRRDMVVARYKSDGQVDSSFATNGMVEIKVRVHDTGVDTDVDSRAYQVAALPDGGVVVAGTYGNTSTSGNGPGNYAGIVVARLGADGRLVSTFGTGGMTQISCAGGGAYPAGAIISNNNILVGGTCADSSGAPRIVLHSINATSGVAANPVMGAAGTGAYAMLSTPGKIYVAGYKVVSTAGAAVKNAAIVRFNLDGTLDSAFGSGGLVTKSFGNGDSLVTALSQSLDGRVAAVVSSSLESRLQVSVWAVSGSSATANDCSADAQHSENFVPYAALRVAGDQLIVGGPVEANESGVAVTSFTLGANSTDCSSAVQWKTAAGNRGFQIFSADGQYDFVRAFGLTADNKILVAGPSYQKSSSDRAISLARFTVK